MTVRERAWYLSGRLEGLLVPAKLISDVSRRRLKKGDIVLCYKDQFDKQGFSNSELHVFRIPKPVDFQSIRELHTTALCRVFMTSKKYRIGGFDNFSYKVLELLK
jgi:hypothetical protein